MANILYVTSQNYISSRFAGGMGTKTAAILEAWDDKALHTVKLASTLKFLQTSAISSPQADAWNTPESASAPPSTPQKSSDQGSTIVYDVVMLELLAINSEPDFDRNIKILKGFKGPVIVYGSDSELLRWPGKWIDRLSTVVDIWIANCEWQANYFRDFHLPVAGIVHEPIDCDLFLPGKPEQIITAGGMVSYGKNSDFFVELFERLKPVKKEYKTAYIGSADVWGGKPDPVNLQLQSELKKSVDVFHGAISQTKVARAIGKTAVGVLNPHYETCNRFHMELMAGGVATLCGAHICYDERPVTARFRTLDDCIDGLSALTDDFTALPDKKYGQKERQHAETYWSYEASQEQLNEILGSLL